jgi:hypothetical protein
MNWISIDDRRPEQTEHISYYLTIDTNYADDIPEVLKYEKGKFWYYDCGECGDGWVEWDMQITHWMPLPYPSKD